jgi:glutathione peroxidase
MNHCHLPLRLSASLVAMLLLFSASAGAGVCPAFLNHDFKKLHSSESINICEAYAGKPLLLVNTASHCGYTPQFKGLEAIHEKFRNRGLVVIGFPSDDFNQEAHDQAETAQVCYVNYGVTFTMLAPLPVTGDAANVVFKELARQSSAPTWNFNKYLVTGDGRVARYFDSSTPPDAVEFQSAIEQLVR